jgi:hypothetical protein
MIREWLWQRPYTTLELQHLPGATIEPLPEGAGQGVEGIEIGKDSQRFSICPNKSKSFLKAIILLFSIIYSLGACTGTFYLVRYRYLLSRLNTIVALLSSNKVLCTVIHLNRLRWLVEIDFYYLWTTLNKKFWLLDLLIVSEVLR